MTRHPRLSTFEALMSNMAPSENSLSPRPRPMSKKLYSFHRMLRNSSAFSTRAFLYSRYGTRFRRSNSISSHSLSGSAASSVSPLLGRSAASAAAVSKP